MELDHHCESKPLGEGIVRQMIHGETLMICRLTLAPGTIAVNTSLQAAWAAHTI